LTDPFRLRVEDERAIYNQEGVQELVQTREKPSIQALLIFLLYSFSTPKKKNPHKHRPGFYLNKTCNSFDSLNGLRFPAALVSCSRTALV